MADTDPRFTADAVAINKRMSMCSVGELDYQQWRHHPITAGFLQYLDDLIGVYRDGAADILESGQFLAGHSHPDKNPDCLRGQIIMLRQIHGLELGKIKDFYGKGTPEDEQEE